MTRYSAYWNTDTEKIAEVALPLLRALNVPWLMDADGVGRVVNSIESLAQGVENGALFAESGGLLALDHGPDFQNEVGIYVRVGTL